MFASVQETKNKYHTIKNLFYRKACVCPDFTMFLNKLKITLETEKYVEAFIYTSG